MSDYLLLETFPDWSIDVCLFHQLFNEYLSLESRSELQSASQGGADDAYEKKAAEQLTLWRSVLLRYLENSLVN